MVIVEAPWETPPDRALDTKARATDVRRHVVDPGVLPIFLVEHRQHGLAVRRVQVRGLGGQRGLQDVRLLLHCVCGGLGPDAGDGGQRIGRGGDHDAGDESGAEEGHGTTSGGKGSVAHVVKL
jgi:hypothetical protein